MRHFKVFSRLVFCLAICSVSAVCAASASAAGRSTAHQVRVTLPPPPAGGVHCSLYASPTGSDTSGNGSISAPFASVSMLDQSLSPGQTGCLRGGSYGGLHTYVRLGRDGHAGDRITITSYPGETATINGWVDIVASYTTLQDLSIDGSNELFWRHADPGCSTKYVSASLDINGRNDIFQYVDYYQSVRSLRADGIGIGFSGDADNTIIRYSKIHDVGSCRAYDHLIYLSHGNNVQIYGDWLYDDPHGDGVQLYPDPSNARIFDNVVDATGEGFVIGDEPGDVASGNHIFNNIIANTTGLSADDSRGDAIHDYWGGTPGTGNRFFDNILYDVPVGIGCLTTTRAFDNPVANPRFVDRRVADFRTDPGGPTTGWDMWNGQLRRG